MMLFKRIMGSRTRCCGVIRFYYTEHLVPKGSAKTPYNTHRETYMIVIYIYTPVLWQPIILLIQR